MISLDQIYHLYVHHLSYRNSEANFGIIKSRRLNMIDLFIVKSTDAAVDLGSHKMLC